MAAYRARHALWLRVRRWLTGFDLLAVPTVPIRPFGAGYHRPRTVPDKGDLPWLAWAPSAYTFNLTGQPALSVPVGHAADGLPVGMQLVGDWRADHIVLHGGRELQRAHRPPRRPGATFGTATT
jgi:aspartyl-tRNA(Asn)/glutamyl-tRNA(Gln) amidotransferase subunit A